MSEEKLVIREKTAMILRYLQSLSDDVNMTAKEVAKAIQLTPKQVDASFTSGIKAKGYGLREEVQIQDSEGRWVNIKYLKLTDEGKALNLDEATIKK